MEPNWLFDDSPAMEGATRDAKRTLRELKRDLKAERKLMLDCDKKGNYDEALYHAEECLRCSQEALTYVNTLHSSAPMKIWLELSNFILSGALRAAAYTALASAPGALYGAAGAVVNPLSDADPTKEAFRVAAIWAKSAAPYAIGAGYLVSGVKSAKYKLFSLIDSIGRSDGRNFADKNGNAVINACRADIAAMVDEYQNCVDAYRMKAENRWRFN
jgi:hypothetical protein